MGGTRLPIMIITIRLSLGDGTLNDGGATRAADVPDALTTLQWHAVLVRAPVWRKKKRGRNH